MQENPGKEEVHNEHFPDQFLLAPDGSEESTLTAEVSMGAQGA
jgi:hypothetical protein